MHFQNHYYGHAHIFAKYVGLPFPPMIWGYLQHGWNIHDGFAVGTKFTPGVPKLVWSENVERRGWAMGQREYDVIGSPWAYLMQLEGAPAEPPLPSEEREGTIFYPFHGWEGQGDLGDHPKILRTLLDAESGPLTVCLYWTQFEDEAVRRLYEDSGARVITHGKRGFAYRDTDTEFLTKQLNELRSHRRVVSNRLGSAILYGSSVGCEVGVYGDPVLLENEDPVYGGVERQRRLWPELHAHVANPELAREIAVEELGIRHLRTPAEIMEAFSWTQPK